VYVQKEKERREREITGVPECMSMIHKKKKDEILIAVKTS
jgi:hypothetical protein